jgi:hypothetical protein
MTQMFSKWSSAFEGDNTGQCCRVTVWCSLGALARRILSHKSATSLRDYTRTLEFLYRARDGSLCEASETN